MNRRSECLNRATAQLHCETMFKFIIWISYLKIKVQNVSTAGFQHFLSKLNAEFMVCFLNFRISLKECTFGLNDQMFELKNGMFELTKCMLELNDRPGNTRNACLT